MSGEKPNHRMIPAQRRPRRSVPETREVPPEIRAVYTEDKAAPIYTQLVEELLENAGVIRGDKEQK